MIFCNKKCVATERKMPFGVIHQIGMGQFGRERKFMALTCPEGTCLDIGLNLDYTIGETWSCKPRIIRKNDEQIYMLLSADGEVDDGVFGYDGDIMVLNSQKKFFEVMARGNGLGGAPDDPFFWDCMLLKIPMNITALVKVCHSGSDSKVPSTVYLIHEKKIYETMIDSIVEVCEELGIDVPCEIYEENDGRYYGNDWIQL